MVAGWQVRELRGCGEACVVRNGGDAVSGAVLSIQLFLRRPPRFKKKKFNEGARFRHSQAETSLRDREQPQC